MKCSRFLLPQRILNEFLADYFDILASNQSPVFHLVILPARRRAELTENSM